EERKKRGVIELPPGDDRVKNGRPQARPSLGRSARSRRKTSTEREYLTHPARIGKSATATGLYPPAKPGTGRRAINVPDRSRGNLGLAMGEQASSSPGGPTNREPEYCNGRFRRRGSSIRSPVVSPRRSRRTRLGAARHRLSRMSRFGTNHQVEERGQRRRRA